MSDQHAEYVCVGGPLDGRLQKCEGARLIVPMITAEYQRAYSEWHEKYVVAWAVETIDGLPEWPRTPPPPNYPQAVYSLYRGEDGRVVLLHNDGNACPEGHIEPITTDVPEDARYDGTVDG